MRTFGYCRVSRKTQNIERQIRNIKAVYPDALIVQEAATGTKLDGRKELDKLLKILREGDTLVFDSASRMSRNEDEAIVPGYLEPSFPLILFAKLIKSASPNVRSMKKSDFIKFALMMSVSLLIFACLLSSFFFGDVEEVLGLRL